MKMAVFPGFAGVSGLGCLTSPVVTDPGSAGELRAGSKTWLSIVARSWVAHGAVGAVPGMWWVDMLLGGVVAALVLRAVASGRGVALK